MRCASTQGTHRARDKKKGQATFLATFSVVRDGCLPVYRPEELPAVHAVAQRGEFMINEQLIDPLKPLGRRLDGSGVAQMRESQARPGPVPSRAQPDPHGQDCGACSGGP